MKNNIDFRFWKGMECWSYIRRGRKVILTLAFYSGSDAILFAFNFLTNTRLKYG